MFELEEGVEEVMELGRVVGGAAVCLGVLEERADVVRGLKVPSGTECVMVGCADVRARRMKPAMKVNRMVDRWRSLMCKSLLTA